MEEGTPFTFPAGLKSLWRSVSSETIGLGALSGASARTPMTGPGPPLMDTSSRMRRVRRSDTALELRFRRALWARGVRYRVHPPGVEGRPDLGVRGRRVVVFIDGCFWHGCPICKDYPSANRAFWEAKFRYNQERREKVRSDLKGKGWRVVEVWGHEINQDLDSTVTRVARALTDSPLAETRLAIRRRSAAVIEGKS